MKYPIFCKVVIENEVYTDEENVWISKIKSKNY